MFCRALLSPLRVFVACGLSYDSCPGRGMPAALSLDKTSAFVAGESGVKVGAQTTYGSDASDSLVAECNINLGT